VKDRALGVVGAHNGSACVGVLRKARRGLQRRFVKPDPIEDLADAVDMLRLTQCEAADNANSRPSSRRPSDLMPAACISLFALRGWIGASTSP